MSQNCHFVSLSSPSVILFGAVKHWPDARRNPRRGARDPVANPSHWALSVDGHCSHPEESPHVEMSAVYLLFSLPECKLFPLFFLFYLMHTLVINIWSCENRTKYMMVELYVHNIVYDILWDRWKADGVYVHSHPRAEIKAKKDWRSADGAPDSVPGWGGRGAWVGDGWAAFTGCLAICPGVKMCTHRGRGGSLCLAKSRGQWVRVSPRGGSRPSPGLPSTPSPNSYPHLSSPLLDTLPHLSLPGTPARGSRGQVGPVKRREDVCPA